MSRGKASIYLCGGIMDKEVIENIDTRLLKDEISFPKKTWVRKAENGFEIMSGGKMDENWVYTANDIYRKTLRRKMGSIVYEFKASVDVDRCTAKTKLNKRCMKASLIGMKSCESHQ